MTPLELKTLLPELQQKRFAHTDVNQLIAYARIYVALHTTVSINALDSEYGPRKLYLEKSYTVFDKLSHAYDEQTDAALRAEILRTLFYIVHGTVGVPDRKREARCYTLAQKLIDRYLSLPQAESADAPESFRTISLLLICLYGEIDTQNESDPYSNYIKQTLSAWAQQVDSSGRWKDTPLTHALQRLTLLNMNSYMLLDGQYDTLIRSLYSFYCTNDHLPSAGKLLSNAERYQLTLHYDLATSIILPTCNDPFINRLGDLFSHQYRLLPTDSDQALLCLSIAIENACNRITNHIQEEIMSALV